MDNLVVPGLLRNLRQYGNLDVNGCLNCGCCTVVCDLSSGSVSFPRKPMQLALLGLEGPLRQSFEPWLCHDCRDCSSLCPRGAEPAEAMATLRRYLAAEYDMVGLASRIYRSKVWAIAILSFTALLVIALAYFYHAWVTGLSASELLSTPMGMEHMFNMINVFTRVVFLIPLFLLLAGVYRMYGMTMRSRRIPFRFYAAEVKTILIQMATHRQLKACPEEKRRHVWLGHWLLGLSFALMSVILFFFLRWFQTDSIFPLYHPQRWLGYLIAGVMIVVPARILVGRIRRSEPMHKFSSLEDLTLPALILLTAASGIALHGFRYLGFALASHLAYAAHLAISVPLLVIEVPFGKLSHAIYRPVAIYFRTVSERALSAVKSDARPDESSAAPEKVRVA